MGAATGPDNRGGIEYGAGIVQGTQGRPENNNFKDYYGYVSYKIGGLGVVGSRTETNEQPNTAEGYTETSVQIGTFGYRGKGQPAINGVAEDWLMRSGFKADIWLKNLNVFGAVVLGTDELRGSSPRTTDSSSIMGEAELPDIAVGHAGIPVREDKFLRRPEECDSDDPGHQFSRAGKRSRSCRRPLFQPCSGRKRDTDRNK
jgi:hypothetical protein